MKKSVFENELLKVNEDLNPNIPKIRVRFTQLVDSSKISRKNKEEILRKLGIVPDNELIQYLNYMVLALTDRVFK